MSTVSMLNTSRERVRKKLKRLATVTMEADKADLPLEATVVKAKRLTGRDYKSFYAKGALASRKVVEKRADFEVEEERPQSASKKKRRLVKKYLQRSPDKTASFRGEAAGNVNKESDEDYIGDMVNIIQKKCEQRMRKLVRKQKHQIQEFNEVWEGKMLEVLEGKKLEAAIIRAIYGNSSKTVDKLMILDEKFSKKEAENKCLRDMQLKDLEADQLAARNEESEKAAMWMSQAESCIYDEQMSCCKAQSLGVQGVKDSGCSESRTKTVGAKDAVPLAGQHGEIDSSSRTVQGKHALEPNNSDCGTTEKVGCSILVKSSSRNEGGDVSVPAVVELINDPKHFRDGESICINLPASGDMQSLELHGDVTAELPEPVVNAIMDDVRMDQSTSHPVEGFSERDAIDVPDALLNKRNETDGTTIDELDSAGQVLKTSEQTKASPHPSQPLLVQEVTGIQDQGLVNSSPPEVFVSEHVDTATNLLSNIETQDQEEPATETESSTRTDIAVSKITDTVIAEQSSIKLQDQDAPVVKDQVILQKEVADSERSDTAPSFANSELVDTAMLEVAASVNVNKTMPPGSSTAMQDEDVLTVQALERTEVDVSNSGLVDIATPVQSHIDEPAIENCEQLPLIPIDESPSCNQLLSNELESEIHNPERISSEAAESELPSYESTSRVREDVERHSSNLDIGPGSQSYVECPPASFQINEALQIEFLNHDILWLAGVSPPIHEVAARNSPSLYANPFVNELERIRKETEQLLKSHENTISCLNSEFKKEMEELKNKYKLKCEYAREQFTLKKSGLDQNQKKVFMNKLLLDASNNLLNCSPTGSQMQQVSSSSSMQHLQHLMRPAGTTYHHPASILQLASLNGQAMQQISIPHSTRSGQTYAAPSAQAQLVAVANSGVIARPGGIVNANHPMTGPRFGGDIHSSFPFPQAPVPSTPPSMPFLRNYHQLQQQQWSPISQNLQHISYPTALPHGPLSAFVLERHPLNPGNHTSPTAGTNPSFGSLQRSHFDALSNAQGSQGSSGAATNAICLTDD